jgi:hypothetical protein
METNNQSEPEDNKQPLGGQLLRLRRALEHKREQSRARAKERFLVSPEGQPDQLSPRAKSSGHGKKTADKWNQ